MFGKKSKIAELEIKVKNRDKLIGEQQRTIECLKDVINSLEEDLKALKEEAYKTAKKPVKKRTSRPQKSN